jgi:hypothetical protein
LHRWPNSSSRQTSMIQYSHIRTKMAWTESPHLLNTESAGSQQGAKAWVAIRVIYDDWKTSSTTSQSNWAVESTRAANQANMETSQYGHIHLTATRGLHPLHHEAISLNIRLEVAWSGAAAQHPAIQDTIHGTVRTDTGTQRSSQRTVTVQSGHTRQNTAAAGPRDPALFTRRPTLPMTTL